MSRAKRIQFWAGVQASQAAQTESDLATVSSNPPLYSTPLGSANVHAATLESAVPTPPGEGVSVPGLDQTGFVPPPPTGAG